VESDELKNDGEVHDKEWTTRRMGKSRKTRTPAGGIYVGDETIVIVPSTPTQI
jgi:hypothetical protein